VEVSVIKGNDISSFMVSPAINEMFDALRIELKPSKTEITITK
jgi:hypothetical protein